MRPILVTGHTPDYAEAAELLAMQVEAFGEEILIVPYEDRGSWMRNIRAKADCLVRARAMFDRPLIWIDADSTMHRGLPSEDWIRWGEDYDFSGPLVAFDRPRKYYVGCLYFNNTAAGDALLIRWWQLCEADTDETGEGDEHWLEHARLEREKDTRWGIMPVSYAWLPTYGSANGDTVFSMGLSGKAGKYAPKPRKIVL